MRYLVLMCLWLCVACKSSVRSPVSDLHAVTDGRVTLGAVASENEEGLQVYRLLLCKKSAIYNAATFADSRQCLPALLDDAGQEVVLLHNSLRRTFAAKYGKYAKIAAGVALVAGGVYAGHRWLARKSYRKLSSLTERQMPNAHNFHQDHQETVQLIKKHLDEMNLTDKELNEAIEAADPATLDNILKEFKIDLLDVNAPVREAKYPYLAIRRVDEYLRSKLLDGRIDKKMLDKFAEKLKYLDEVYAQEIKELKKARQPITDSDMHYFAYVYEKANKLFNKNVKARLDKISKGFMHNQTLTSTEKLIIAEHLRTLTNLRRSINLRSEEIELDLLLKLKNKQIDTAHIQNKVDSLLKNDTEFKDEKLNDILDRFSDFEYMEREIDYERILDRGSVAAWEVNKYLKVVQSLPVDEKGRVPVTLIRELAQAEAYGSVFSRLDEFEDLAKLDNRIKEVTGEIARQSRIMLEEDAHHLGLSALGRTWKKLQDAARLTPYNQERFDELQRTVDAFSREIEMEQTPQLRFLQQIQADSAAKMQRGLDMLKNNDHSAFDKLMEESAKEREMMGRIFAATAGVGTAAALIALDKSIWGHGEKQLGDYWSQIFSDKASFADATAVEDMPAVLNKLAEVLGYRINPAALNL